MKAAAPPYKAAPASPESEQALLGCAATHPAAYQEAAVIFGDRNVFFVKEHALVWDILSRWYTSHEARPEASWIVGEMLQYDGLNSIAGDCVSRGCIPANAGFHAQVLIDKWRLREARNRAATIARYADAGDTEGLEAAIADLAECNSEAVTASLLNPQSVINAGEPPPVVFRGGMVQGIGSNCRRGLHW